MENEASKDFIRSGPAVENFLTLAKTLISANSNIVELSKVERAAMQQIDAALSTVNGANRAISKHFQEKRNQAEAAEREEKEIIRKKEAEARARAEIGG